MPLTPWSDRSPWTTTQEVAQRVREEEEKKRKHQIIVRLANEARQAGIGSEQSNILQKLRRDYQQEQENQQRRYRGILSGPANIFTENGINAPPGAQRGYQEPTDSGFNPFKSILRGAQVGLEKWQEATESAAGATGQLFSEQVRRNLRKGLGYGEAWRQSQFATTRIGKEKGEGFGFNVGVKGAYEMLVDPVGWAAMALPLGLIMKPFGKGANKLLNITPQAKAGKAAKERMVKGIDAEVLSKLKLKKGSKGELAKLLKGTALTPKQQKEVLQKGFASKHTHAFRKLGELDLKTPNNKRITEIMNYDEILEQRGLLDESFKGNLLRYINDPESQKQMWMIAKPFWLGLRNVHKLFNPAYNKGATQHGRLSLAYNGELGAIQGKVDSLVATYNQPGFNFNINQTDITVGINQAPIKGITTEFSRKTQRDILKRSASDLSKESEYLINMTPNGKVIVWEPGVGPIATFKAYDTQNKLAKNLIEGFDDTDLLARQVTKLDNFNQNLSDARFMSMQDSSMGQAVSGKIGATQTRAGRAGQVTSFDNSYFMLPEKMQFKSPIDIEGTAITKGKNTTPDQFVQGLFDTRLGRMEQIDKQMAKISPSSKKYKALDIENRKELKEFKTDFVKFLNVMSRNQLYGKQKSTFKKHPKQPIRKIISGGQTGADQFGIEAAMDLGIDYGGSVALNDKGKWMLADAAVSPRYGEINLSGKFDNSIRVADMPGRNLKQKVAEAYRRRTAKNVADSDGTVYFSNNFMENAEELAKTRGISITKGGAKGQAEAEKIIRKTKKGQPGGAVDSEPGYKFLGKDPKTGKPIFEEYRRPLKLRGKKDYQRFAGKKYLRGEAKLLEEENLKRALMNLPEKARRLKPSPGQIATFKAAKESAKPFLLDPDPAQLRAWIQQHNIKTLNIAGSRGDWRKIGTKQTTGGRRVRHILRQALGIETKESTFDFAPRTLSREWNKDVNGNLMTSVRETVPDEGMISNAQDAFSFLIPSSRGSAPGNLNKAVDHIMDFSTAANAIRTMREGLKRNRLYVTVPGRKIDNLGQLFANSDVEKAVIGNIMRAFDKSGFTGKRQIDALLYKDTKGQTQFLHRAMGDLYDKFPGAFKELPAHIQEKYPQLATMGTAQGVKEVTMSALDFLDTGAQVVGYNNSLQRPIRKYNHIFDLNPTQIEFLEGFYNDFDEGANLLKAHGIDFENIFENTTGNYVHHMVEEFGDIEQLVQDQTLSRVLNSTAITQKAAFKNQRKNLYASEGIEEQGLLYNSEPTHILKAFLTGVYKEIAQKKYVNNLELVAEKEVKGIAGQIEMLGNWKTALPNLEEQQKVFKNIGGAIDSGLIDEVAMPAIDKIDELMKEVNLGAIVADEASAESWSQIRGRLQDIAQRGGHSDEILEVLNNWNKTIEKGYQKRINYFTRLAKKYDASGIKGNEYTRKLKNLYTKESVEYRAVKDQRNPYAVEVKALNEKQLFFDDITASAIEADLGIDAKKWFDEAISTTSKYNDTLRTIQTGFDGGTAMLHGLPTLLSGLGRVGTGTGRQYLSGWVKGTKKMIGMIALGATRHGRYAPKLHAKHVADNFDTYQQMAQYGVLISGSGNDYFKSKGNDFIVQRVLKEGRFSKRQEVGALPGFESAKPFIDEGGAFLDGFQTSFELYGDIIRETLWNAHYNQIVKSGSDNVEKELFQLAEYVNGMSGAFSSKKAGISARQANIESSIVFFSPSYTRASLGLVGSVLSGGLQGDEARRSIRAMMAAGLMTHSGVAISQAKSEAIATGKKVPWDKYIKLNPSKADFLTTDLHGVNVGFGSTWMSLARTLSKITKDPAFRGDLLDSPLLMTGAGRGEAGFNEQGIKDILANNHLAYWLRSRSSPAGSTMWNLGMGANFLGDEMRFASGDHISEILKGFSPFWAQSGFEQLAEGNIREGILGAVSEFGGLRNVPVSNWEKRNQVRDMLGKQHFGTSWRDLNDVQKRHINESDIFETDVNRQRLLELDAEIKEKRRVVGGGELDGRIDEYEWAIDDAREVYKQTVAMHASELSEGNMSLTQYRIQERRARADYGNALQRQSENYEDVTAYFESGKGKLNDTERFEDFASDEYAEIYFNEEWDLGYMFDYQAREKALSEWRDIWGPEFEEYAKTRLFGPRWNANGFNQEYYNYRDHFFPRYFEETRKQIFQNRWQGQLDTAYQQWYKAKHNPLVQAMLLESNSNLKKAMNEWDQLKLEFRRKDPELDAFLYRWGHTSVLEHSWNSGRELELKAPFPMQIYVRGWPGGIGQGFKVAGE